MMIVRQVQYCAVPRAMPCAITFCAPRYQEGDEICPSCAQGQGVKPLWQTGPASLPGTPKNSQNASTASMSFMAGAQPVSMTL